MALTQLPQHVLQNIISLTISTNSLSQSLELCLVSQQFDREVKHAIFDRDEKQVIELVEGIRHKIPLSVVFRFLRGFILRRDQVGRQLRFWQQLDSALSILTTYKAKEQTGPVILETTADRFFPICPSPNNFAFERAVAMLCDALVAFSDGNFDPLDMTSRQWYDTEGYWDVLRDKVADFWVMAVAARRNDLELCKSAIERLKECSSISRSVVALNLADGLRIPAQEGLQDMVNLLLSQEEVELLDVKRRIHPDMRTTMELAIFHGNMSIIKTLISLGWNLVDLPLDYASALFACVTSDIDDARRQVLEFLLDLTNEWRSEQITTGIIKELCFRGDIDCVKMVIGRYQESTGDHSPYEWDWAVGLLGFSALYGAISSHHKELVRYILDNRQTLPAILQHCFSDEGYLQSVEQAISERQPEILSELLKETLPPYIIRERLFTLAVLKGDPQCLECLKDGIDLKAKLYGHLLDLDEYQDGSRLRREMSLVQWRKTALLSTPGLLTLGAFNLILALKAYNIENVKYLLEQGVRIGRRYVEITRNHQTRSGALLIDDDDFLPGKGMLLGITWKMHPALSFRHMLNQGGQVLPKTLVVARFDKVKHRRIIEDFEREEHPEQEPQKQGILSKIWERCLLLSFATSRYMRGNDASVLLQVEVPVPETQSSVHRGCGRLQATFTEMQDILWKYRQPSIYFDYASLNSYGGFRDWDD